MMHCGCDCCNWCPCLIIHAVSFALALTAVLLHIFRRDLHQ